MIDGFEETPAQGRSCPLVMGVAGLHFVFLVSGWIISSFQGHHHQVLLWIHGNILQIDTRKDRDTEWFCWTPQLVGRIACCPFPRSGAASVSVRDRVALQCQDTRALLHVLIRPTGHFLLLSLCGWAGLLCMIGPRLVLPHWA